MDRLFSTLYYKIKVLGVRRHANLFWKVLCTHFFRKCFELYRGNIFQVFVELQWHSFEIIYLIENLHVEAFLAVFALFLHPKAYYLQKMSYFLQHRRQKPSNKFWSIDFLEMILVKHWCPKLKLTSSLSKMFLKYIFFHTEVLEQEYFFLQ